MKKILFPLVVAAAMLASCGNNNVPASSASQGSEATSSASEQKGSSAEASSSKEGGKVVDLKNAEEVNLAAKQIAGSLIGTAKKTAIGIESELKNADIELTMDGIGTEEIEYLAETTETVIEDHVKASVKGLGAKVNFGISGLPGEAATVEMKDVKAALEINDLQGKIGVEYSQKIDGEEATPKIVSAIVDGINGLELSGSAKGYLVNSTVYADITGAETLVKSVLNIVYSAMGAAPMAETSEASSENPVDVMWNTMLNGGKIAYPLFGGEEPEPMKVSLPSLTTLTGVISAYLPMLDGVGTITTYSDESTNIAIEINKDNVFDFAYTVISSMAGEEKEVPTKEEFDKMVAKMVTINELDVKLNAEFAKDSITSIGGSLKVDATASQLPIGAELITLVVKANAEVETGFKYNGDVKLNIPSAEELAKYAVIELGGEEEEEL